MINDRAGAGRGYRKKSEESDLLPRCIQLAGCKFVIEYGRPSGGAALGIGMGEW